MKTLTISNLACKRGAKLVFDNISFEISSGQTFLIQGNNGSGKTSLLRTISGFIEPHDGDILLDGKNIFSYHDCFKDFQFIGQKNALKDNLSVRRNIYLWSLLFKSSVNTDDILDTFYLKNLVNNDVSTLSEGQKKRLSLSRLFLKESPIWLLDEPFVFLDQKNMTDFNEKILKFNQKGGITIITSNINVDFKFHKIIKL
jgi:heme exporter protein A